MNQYIRIVSLLGIGLIDIFSQNFAIILYPEDIVSIKGAEGKR